MEIVGGIASITQLTHYALSLIATITGIYREVQDGPTRQDQKIKQLERLFSTVQTLNASSVLSTSNIKEHLEAIIVRIEFLKVLLERIVAQQAGRPFKKYLKAFIKDNREEDRILEVFIDLEKDKSALLLSIAETHTELSARIYNELTEQSLCTQAAQIEMPPQQKLPSLNNKVAMKSLFSSSVNESSIAIISGSKDQGKKGPHPTASEVRPDAKQDIEAPATKGFLAAPYPKNDLPDANGTSQKMTGHLFESITFLGSADIHAGNVGESKHGDEPSQKHHYKKIQAKDGRLVTGNAYSDDYWDKFFRKKT